MANSFGIGKKTQRKIKRKIGKATKSVSTFARKHGADISAVGSAMTAGAMGTGAAAPIVAAVGQGLRIGGRLAAVGGVAEQSIRKARRKQKRDRI